MKIPLLAFALSECVFIFSVIQRSTDAYEVTALSGLVPFYLISLACFCFLFATWRGNMLVLAVASAIFLTSIVSLPYLKYSLLYGTAYDNMHHFQVAEDIYNTGHFPSTDPYFGFTTFHSVTVMISLLTGLPLVVGFKMVLILLSATIQLAAYWIAIRVLRTAATVKLAILSGVIVFATSGAAGPPLTAWFLTVLTVALSLEFVSVSDRGASRVWIVPMIMLVLGAVITHHQTAFFAIISFVSIGVVMTLLRDLLKTTGIVAPVILMVGLLALVISYLWWTYYAGFTQVLQTVASIVKEESPEVPTTIGRGISAYGLIGWLYRTMVLYAQRGQEFVWTGIGLLVSLLYLFGRIRRQIVDSETHAVVFMHSLLFMLLWSAFIFVPFFVIGPDRFFRFAFLVSAPFMALGMEAVYSALKWIARIGRLQIPRLPGRSLLHAGLAFALLVLVFAEYTSPFFLAGLSAAGSSYQYDQLVFLDNRYVPGMTVVSHLILTNQIPPYAPHVEYSEVMSQAADLLHDFYFGKPLPAFARGSVILFYRMGPAGGYFEAINVYLDESWIPGATAKLLSLPASSLLYNSGEGFILSPF